MAACHPKLKTLTRAELFLSRFADGEWAGVVRPWLEAGRGRLERALVVAPTRGQTQALKQRCVEEGVALLGVEFLTPGLARKKRGDSKVLGRSLQLLVLRTGIERRMAALGPEDPALGLWRSLASDLESALSEFEDLMRGGFRAHHFPRPELREVFAEMAAWIERHGYALAPIQDEAAALQPPNPGDGDLAGRLLILGGGTEGWPDFFGLVALARRSASVTVVLAEPEFSGMRPSDEEWVGAWEKALGVEACVVEADDPAETCAAVADLWAGGEGSAERAAAIVGRSRADEIILVADELGRLLARGSDNIAVIFPGAGSAHARLVRLLEERAVPYADLIGSAGTPPVDTRIQRGLADYYARGCRMEELLALWPLLRSLGLVKISPADARGVCEALFDAAPEHALARHADRLATRDKPDGNEVGRVARLLGAPWPDPLIPTDGLSRFEAARDALGLAEPAGWAGLREFARRTAEPLPAAAFLDALLGFLPEKAPLAGGSMKRGFARVTLTTCRRAAGVAWSDAIFVEANAGIWPEPREPSCWLGDDARRSLDRESGRFSLGLPTSEDRAVLERRLYCAIARDTRGRVAFSAALFGEEDPEVRLGPNVWLERVMWSQALYSEAGPEAKVFEDLAREGPAIRPGHADPWRDIWLRRRNPSAPFDEYFLADPTGATRPERLSAKLIERGLGDPAVLWFEAVLRVTRVEWRAFVRARRKAMGTAVHSALAAALRGPPAEGSFFALPDRAAAAGALAGELTRLRAQWPADRYWDSFHMDVSGAARELLEHVFELPPAVFGAVEVRVPGGASVPVSDTQRISVGGRMDLVLSDRPGWEGACVEIVDFKTGGDARLSAKSMGSRGASLQLGVYLEAALSVGATGGVWMLKPGRRPARIGMHELAGARAKLRVLGRHLATGIYGARTADRSEHREGFEWPLACAPIAAAILEAKFALTFGAEVGSEPTEDADE